MGKLCLEYLKLDSYHRWDLSMADLNAEYYLPCVPWCTNVDRGHRRFAFHAENWSKGGRTNWSAGRVPYIGLITSSDRKHRVIHISDDNIEIYAWSNINSVPCLRSPLSFLFNPLPWQEWQRQYLRAEHLHLIVADGKRHFAVEIFRVKHRPVHSSHWHRRQRICRLSFFPFPIECLITMYLLHK